MLRPHLQIQLLTAAARRVGAAGGRRSQRGSIALFLLVALAVTVGAVAIANSSSNNLIRSGFMGQSREARQVALDGAQTIIDELNRVPNRRLLVSNAPVNTWDNANTTANEIFRNTRCTKNGTMPTNEAINLTKDSFNGTTNGGFRSVAGDNTRQFRLLDVQKFATKARNSAATTPPYDENDINIISPPSGRPIDNQVGYIQLQVQGRVLRGGNVVSTATVTREFEVVPKCCGQSFGLPIDPADTTRGAHGMDISKCEIKDTNPLGEGLYGIVFGIGGGGLYDTGKSGFMRTKDKDGEYVSISNVVCAVTDDGDPATVGSLEDCTSTGFTDTKVNTSLGTIGRSITYNDFTKVPTFQQPGTPITAGSLDDSITNLRVFGGNVQQSTNNGVTYTNAPYCRSYSVNGNLEYHCLLSKIEYKTKNSSLTVDTTNGDINLYVTYPGIAGKANKEAVSFGGNSALIHKRGTPPASATSCATDGNAFINAFSIFGTPSDVQPPVGTASPPDISSNQEISIQGDGSITGVFIWAPYSLVSVGGGGGEVNICGRIWSNSLSVNGNIKFETPPTSGGPGTGPGGPPGDPTENLVDWVARSVSDLRLFKGP